MKPRFFTFWSINARLNQTQLRKQLEQFRAIGFDGVVWHPRFYQGEPPYLSDSYLAEVSEVILHAKSLGLAFWLYDEDGWPSGTVGGQLLKKYPGDAQRWAELVPERPERCLVEFQRDGGKWFLAERIGQGVDYFSPDLARHFIELTHERYRAGLKREAWEHIEAIFCDEPEFGLGHAYDSLSKHGAIPWTPKLPELFRRHHGEDLLQQIGSLLFGGNGAQVARVQFWELLTDLFNESFVAPVNEWCRRHGKLFTAHVKGEEHPFFQVPTNGSCHQFFRNLSLPGIDALERYPGNNFYPRQVSSAARQFGNGRCMVEAFGGAGWGSTPEDLERYLLWVGRHGLTDFVLHLSQYRLDSAALHDWPPSQPLHLTWSEVYPEVLRHVRRDLETNPRPSADTLVVAPIRGVMANYQPLEWPQTNVHNAATYPDSVAGKINRCFLEQVEQLHRAGVNYDVADERTLEQLGKEIEGRLTLGRCAYRHVIVPDGCELDPAARAQVQRFLHAPVIGTPALERKAARTGLRTGVPVAVQWKLETHPRNQLLLECEAESDGWFAAAFDSAAGLNGSKLELCFADDIAEVKLNQQDLAIAASDDGSTAVARGSLLRPANTLRFHAADRKVQRPFVWLRGQFRVMSSAPFISGPSQTIKTDGPFAIHPPRETILADLVADGFPFLFDKLTVTAEVNVADAVVRLRFDEVEADALRLFVDERDCGWTWRSGGEFVFRVELSVGRHRLKLELLPNSFNGFGPHHYYLGDWPVISPDQIKGIRNFADPLDAPGRTHVKAWHFRRFRLPSHITIQHHE